MTHLYTIESARVENLWKFWAQCTCGWESLRYNNSAAADLAGTFHLEDNA